MTDTLSGRLALVFTLLVLPPTMISLWLAYESYVEYSARARVQVRQFATLTATYENRFFDDVRTALQDIAGAPVLRAGGGSGGNCEEVLQAARDRTPEFAAIGFFDREGRQICATRQSFEDVSDRSWFRTLQGFRGFGISDYTVPPGSPFPVIVAAQSVYGADYQFQGVLAASIRLYWLSALIRELSLPPESVFFLIDRNGTILADRSALLEEGGTVGTLPPSGFRNLAEVIGIDLATSVLSRRLTDIEVEGPDGVRRVFSSVALPHGDVTILFGMPAVSTLGGFEKDLINRVLGLAAIWFSGIGAAWLGTRHLVTRWIGTLRARARAYGAGDYERGVPLARAPRELRELSEAMSLMARRIEEREEELRRSLHQKDMVLREIHHRVKNNLQIVSSLLNIRGSGAGGDAAAALDEVKAHVRAMALVHRHLYESDDVQRVDLQSFMTELCQSTVKLLCGRREGIELELSLPPHAIATDRAIPLALLVTEAMTNSVKHAFPGGRRGRIAVRFEATGPDAGVLEVSDDGIGIPEAARRGGGIGLSLIEAFARQIGGRIEIEGPPGTRIRVHLAAEAGPGEPAPDQEAPPSSMA